MKGEKLNDLRPQELKPVEEERREQGLRLLARMIARVYACDIKVVRKTDREPNSPLRQEVTNRQFEKAQLKKAVHRGNWRKRK